ncbi:MAG: hypothetical protein IT390_02525 [Nitrospira sp.]|nr:hypothetical protein [Nitrospira sp.]
MLALALLAVGGCAGTPTTSSPDSAAARQRAVLRGYVTAMTERDELYESFSGLQRGEPNFDAAKQSIGAVYRDPVVMEWMVDQLWQDRTRFARRFATTLLEGFARAGDDAAWKLVRPVGEALGRLGVAQCDEYRAEVAAGRGRGAPMASLVRRMQPAEVHEFFDGLRLALRAGIEQAPQRPLASRAEIALALVSVPAAFEPGATPLTECSAALAATNAIRGASGATRTNLLSVMMASAGLGVQRVLPR